MKSNGNVTTNYKCNHKINLINPFVSIQSKVHFVWIKKEQQTNLTNVNEEKKEVKWKPVESEKKLFKIYVERQHFPVNM